MTRPTRNTVAEDLRALAAFEQVFARQVRPLGRPGDVLFLHSTSGRSPNLSRAAEAARERGVVTIGPHHMQARRGETPCWRST